VGLSEILVGTRKFLPSSGGRWRPLSPDTVIAQREVPPVTEVRTSDSASHS